MSTLTANWLAQGLRAVAVGKRTEVPFEAGTQASMPADDQVNDNIYIYIYGQMIGLADRKIDACKERTHDRHQTVSQTGLRDYELAINR